MPPFPGERTVAPVCRYRVSTPTRGYATSEPAGGAPAGGVLTSNPSDSESRSALHNFPLAQQPHRRAVRAAVPASAWYPCLEGVLAVVDRLLHERPGDAVEWDLHS